MTIQRKISIFISVCMGLVMGATFTAISMAKNGQIIPMGIIMSALMSMGISGLIGCIVSMKNITESIQRKLGLNPAKQKFLCVLVEAITGDLIFTPLLCTFFIIKNVGVHNPMFVKILLSSLLIDFLIGIPLNTVFCPLFRKAAGKIFRVADL